MGQRKSENEDSYLVGSMTPDGAAAAVSMLLAVADGMGGHGDGRTASAVAVDAVARHLFETLPQTGAAADDATVTATIEQAFQTAKVRVEQVAMGGKVSMKMGTTLTLIFVYGGKFYLGHAGDSRGYKLRGHDIARLTKDHTVGEQLREQVEGTPAENLVDSRWDSALSNAVGGGCAVLRVETGQLDVAPGDRLLLCSDGLSVLDDSAVTALLEAPSFDETIAQRLVDAAAEAGSHDDITALIARVG